jgi:hypothetical protein
MFNKVTIATAFVAAANAGAFTADQAASFAGRQLHREEAKAFTTADIPKVSALFSVFDTNADSMVEPKEIWAAHESMSNETTKKAFMLKMDAGMRVFCGVPAKPAAGRLLRGGRKSGSKSKKGGNWMQKMKAKGKKMMNAMATKKMFMQFAMADSDFDMKVSPMEMGVLMTKMQKKMCMKYKKEQMKTRAMAWMKAGVPAEV